MTIIAQSATYDKRISEYDTVVASNCIVHYPMLSEGADVSDTPPLLAGRIARAARSDDAKPKEPALLVAAGLSFDPSHAPHAFAADIARSAIQGVIGCGLCDAFYHACLQQGMVCVSLSTASLEELHAFVEHARDPRGELDLTVLSAVILHVEENDQENQRVFLCDMPLTYHKQLF